MNGGFLIRRWGMAWVFCFLCVGSLIGEPVVEAASYKYDWKIATLAPDGVGWAVYVKNELFGVFNKVTNGELHMDVYWGGTMGDDEDYIAKMSIGQLDGAGISGGSALLACPEMSVLTLPFLFNDYGEVDFVRNKMRDKFSALCEKNGYKMLVWGDQDFDPMFSTKNEIRTPDDLKKCKVLNVAGTIETAIYQSLTASPIPSGIPDIISNMRSGVCDVAVTPSIWWVGAQLYTITKYVNPIKLRYMPILIVIKNDSWNKLPENYRQLIEKEILENNRENEFNGFVRKTNEQCYDAMVKYGVKETKLTKSEIAVMRDLTRPIWDEYAGKEYPVETLNEILSLLEGYRASKEKS